MEQPTLGAWVVFLVSLALLGYAVWHLVSGLLFGRAGGGETRSQAPRGQIPGWIELLARGGDLAIDWLFLPIWRAIVGLLRALWGAPAAPPSAAPVSTITVPLPRTYVAEDTEGSHQDASSASSVVRPSAPSAPDRADSPALPPAVERLMVDRSREALLDALVAANWSTTQIRAHLKGTNEVIGQEVEAARARLAAPRATPIAGRATNAQFLD